MKKPLKEQVEQFSEFFDIDYGGKWTREDVETILETLETRGLNKKDVEDDVMQDVLEHSIKVRGIDALWEEFGLPKWFGQTAETITFIMEKHPTIIDILFREEDETFIVLRMVQDDSLDKK